MPRRRPLSSGIWRITEPSFFSMESYQHAVEYITADDVIAICLYLMNKMQWILIIVPFVYL